MKLTFHPFGKWAAICLDGVCQGYLTHRDGKTTLHLRKDAAEWLKSARLQGPWESNAACQESVKAASDPFYCAPINLKSGQGAWKPAIVSNNS